jgi:hypothetical protein
MMHAVEEDFICFFLQKDEDCLSHQRQGHATCMLAGARRNLESPNTSVMGFHATTPGQQNSVKLNGHGKTTAQQQLTPTL